MGMTMEGVHDYYRYRRLSSMDLGIHLDVFNSIRIVYKKKQLHTSADVYQALPTPGLPCCLPFTMKGGFPYPIAPLSLGRGGT